MVDDYPNAADLLCEMATSAGFVCEAASSDVEAYRALASRERYSALIVDVNLGPGTTGFDVARFARQMHPQLGVIYISGEVSDASFMTFGVPASQFLGKPIDVDALATALRLVVA